MSSLNEIEISAFAFKEAISKEKHMAVKLKLYVEITKSSEARQFYRDLIAVSNSRIKILQREMKNLNIN